MAPCGFQQRPQPLPISEATRGRCSWSAWLVLHLPACKVTAQEGGPVLGGTHEILCGCSLAWWPLRQMDLCPCSVTCHVLWKRRVKTTVNRAFSRESGTRPCHCCCFFMLSATFGEKKILLRTTSKWQKVYSTCNCSPNSNRLCLSTFFNRNVISSLLRTVKDHEALLAFLQEGCWCCWLDWCAPMG